jgi:phosphatidyl-myo-inositol alpha-mannosyltransferase
MLVAPSLGNESFGIVLTRAYGCVTPVVASDIAGYRDIVTSSSGRVVPPGDPHALASAIVALLADESARAQLDVQARELARPRYSWPRIARRLIQIYQDILDSRRSGRRAADVSRAVGVDSLHDARGVAPVRVAARR